MLLSRCVILCQVLMTFSCKWNISDAWINSSIFFDSAQVFYDRRMQSWVSRPQDETQFLVAREVTSQRVGFDVVDEVFAVVLMFWWSTPEITKDNCKFSMMPVQPVTS